MAPIEPPATVSGNQTIHGVARCSCPTPCQAEIEQVVRGRDAGLVLEERELVHVRRGEAARRPEDSCRQKLASLNPPPSDRRSSWTQSSPSRRPRFARRTRRSHSFPAASSRERRGARASRRRPRAPRASRRGARPRARASGSKISFASGGSVAPTVSTFIAPSAHASDRAVNGTVTSARMPAVASRKSGVVANVRNELRLRPCGRRGPSRRGRG